MKKAITLLITLFTVLFVSFAIISFMYYSYMNQVNFYQKDLAQLRAYWAAYGAKERDVDMIDDVFPVLEYEYNSLDLNSTTYTILGIKINETSFTSQIDDNTSINIQNKDIYTRVLEIESNSQRIDSYK